MSKYDPTPEEMLELAKGQARNLRIQRYETILAIEQVEAQEAPAEEKAATIKRLNTTVSNTERALDVLAVRLEALAPVEEPEPEPEPEPR